MPVNRRPSTRPSSGVSATGPAATRRRVFAALGLFGILAAAACVDSLPAEDLRITTAPPVAKLSVALLWKDFADDPTGARAKYWSKAVEVTGTPTTVPDAEASEPVVIFTPAEGESVRAILISDRAREVTESARVGERLTLKCYCEGLVDGALVLRSCVAVHGPSLPPEVPVPQLPPAGGTGS